MYFGRFAPCGRSFRVLAAESQPTLPGLLVPVEQQSAIGLVVILGGRWLDFGTGTLVAPHSVLTAAHVARQLGEPGAEGWFLPVAGLTAADVDALWLPAIPVAGRKIRTWTLHPAFETPPLGTTRSPFDLMEHVSNDLAILGLLGDPGPAQPIALASSAPAIGSRTQCVGYGSFVRPAGSEILRPSEAILLPPRRGWAQAVVTHHRASKFLQRLPGRMGEAGVIYGDSGGPVLVPGPSGEPLVAGVTVHIYNFAATDLPAAQWMDAEMVDVFRAWIDATVAVSESYWRGRAETEAAASVARGHGGVAALLVAAIAAGFVVVLVSD